MVCDIGQFVVVHTPARRLRRVCVVTGIESGSVIVHAWNKRCKRWTRRKRVPGRAVVAVLKSDRLPSWLTTQDVERAEALVPARSEPAGGLWG